MGKYSVLFVENATEIAAMQDMVDWEQLGFTVLGGTDDCKAAQEQAVLHRPDVVVTELTLGGMNGLTLIQKIKALLPEAKFVILTDTAALASAKAAMPLGVSAYLEKPIAAAELGHTFAMLRKKLDAEAAASANMQSLRQYYQTSLPVMQANFYAALINGRVAAEDLPRYLSDYQIPLSGPCFACLLLHTSSTLGPSGVDPVLLRTSVLHQAKAFFGANWQVAIFSYLANTVIIVQMRRAEEAPGLTDEADRFCKEVRTTLGAVVTIGVGDVTADLLDLPQAYKEARTAVSYRSIYGASRVINLQEVEPTTEMTFSSSSDGGLSDLFKAIHVGPEAAIETAVDTYLARMNETATSIPEHTVVTAEMIGSLYRFAVNNHLQVSALTDNLKGLYLRLPELSPESLHQWLMTVAPAMHEQLKAARENSSTALIQNAKEYVRVNYSDETLSLNDVCQALSVSNSYFSTLFKREEGLSFITYLTNFRLERAARLLLETNEKSQVIGHLCGYADPNYFSSTFKKHFGESPKQYRSGLVANES